MPLTGLALLKGDTVISDGPSGLLGTTAPTSDFASLLDAVEVPEQPVEDAVPDEVVVEQPLDFVTSPDPDRLTVSEERAPVGMASVPADLGLEALVAPTSTTAPAPVVQAIPATTGVALAPRSVVQGEVLEAPAELQVQTPMRVPNQAPVERLGNVLPLRAAPAPTIELGPVAVDGFAGHEGFESVDGFEPVESLETRPAPLRPVQNRGRVRPAARPTPLPTVSDPATAPEGPLLETLPSGETVLAEPVEAPAPQPVELPDVDLLTARFVDEGTLRVELDGDVAIEVTAADTGVDVLLEGDPGVGLSAPELSAELEKGLEDSGRKLLSFEWQEASEERQRRDQRRRPTARYGLGGTSAEAPRNVRRGHSVELVA